MPETALAISQGNLPAHHGSGGCDETTADQRGVPRREHRKTPSPFHIAAHDPLRLGRLPGTATQARAFQRPPIGAPHRAHPSILRRRPQTVRFFPHPNTGFLNSHSAPPDFRSRAHTSSPAHTSHRATRSLQQTSSDERSAAVAQAGLVRLSY